MKVVLDGSAPEGLGDCLPGHDVHTSTALGWKGIKNGKLLKLVESIGTDAFITSDKSMEKQQVFQERSFIAQALETAEVGVVTQVECGRFVPGKHRRPGAVSTCKIDRDPTPHALAMNAAPPDKHHGALGRGAGH